MQLGDKGLGPFRQPGDIKQVVVAVAVHLLPLLGVLIAVSADDRGAEVTSAFFRLVLPDGGGDVANPEFLDEIVLRFGSHGGSHCLWCEAAPIAS